MGLVQVTPPAIEPLTLAEAKTDWLRESYSGQDALITALIVAARQLAEEKTKRAFIEQQWKLTLDEFPRNVDRYESERPYLSQVLYLPKPNLISVDSITYLDLNGAQQTWPPADYIVDTAGLPGRITPAYGLYWPLGRFQANAIEVTFTCGYGPAETDVPEAIKTAMKMMVAHWYENREAVVIMTSRLASSPLPMAVDALLGPYVYMETA